MEILSKLWVAMTTQNENLIMVFSIFLSLIEIPLTMEFFLNVLKIQTSTKQKHLYLAITVPIALVSLSLYRSHIAISLLLRLCL